MSIGSTLKHALGIVEGILIPGASAHTTNLVHAVQEELAKLYGEAAAKLAAELQLDTTGMTGEQKLFAIGDAIVATALRDGIKADAKILKDVALDVAQAAYRSIEPNIGSDIIALAAAISANPLVTVAAELVAPVAQNAADALVPAAAAA